MGIEKKGLERESVRFLEKSRVWRVMEEEEKVVVSFGAVREVAIFASVKVCSVILN